MKKIKIFLLALAVSPALLAGETMQVVFNGGKIRIESNFSPGWTLTQPLAPGVNGQLNFNTVQLSGHGQTLPVSWSGDDSCPININGTYIAANHGDAAGRMLKFASPHGLRSEELGAEFTDEANVRFYLVDLPSPDRAVFLSENRGGKYGWSFVLPVRGTLKNADRVLSGFTVSLHQLLPSLRILRRECRVDGEIVTEPAKKTVKCSNFSILEAYEIMGTDSFLEEVKRNRGKKIACNAPAVRPVATLEALYRFTPDGACVVTQRLKFLRPARIGYFGFIQAGKMVVGKYSSHTCFIPRMKPFESGNRRWDFSAGADLSVAPSQALWLPRTAFADPASPPERVVQYLRGNGLPTVGFAIGYSPVAELTNPQRRRELVGASAGVIYTTNKVYPFAVSGEKLPRVEAGAEFFCVAYRHYFNGAKQFHGHRENDGYLLYFDCPDPGGSVVASLPADVNGARMKILEKSPEAQIITRTSEIEFRSAAAGHAVLFFKNK